MQGRTTAALGGAGHARVDPRRGTAPQPQPRRPVPHRQYDWRRRCHFPASPPNVRVARSQGSRTHADAQCRLATSNAPHATDDAADSVHTTCEPPAVSRAALTTRCRSDVARGRDQVERDHQGGWAARQLHRSVGEGLPRRGVAESCRLTGFAWQRMLGAVELCPHTTPRRFPPECVCVCVRVCVCSHARTRVHEPCVCG